MSVAAVSGPRVGRPPPLHERPLLGRATCWWQRLPTLPASLLGALKGGALEAAADATATVGGAGAGGAATDRPGDGPPTPPAPRGGGGGADGFRGRGATVLDAPRRRAAVGGIRPARAAGRGLHGPAAGRYAECQGLALAPTSVFAEGTGRREASAGRPGHQQTLGPARPGMGCHHQPPAGRPPTATRPTTQLCAGRAYLVPRRPRPRCREAARPGGGRGPRGRTWNAPRDGHRRAGPG